MGQALTRIEQGEAQGIICWKLDRLARNPIDGGQISWFLQKNIIQHIRTFERSYLPQDNVLIMSVEFGMANQYILDLRTNTKRGLMEKVKRGEYASLAPLGYINDTRTKLVVVDKKRSKVVREAFELYAQNNSRLEDIGIFFAKHGIITRGKKPFSRDKVAWILSNPFYYGLFKYAGEFYEGKHQTIITKKLFDKVQKVLQERSKPQKPHQDPLGYCGLLRCGNCDMMITGGYFKKVQKNGNVNEWYYYHCTKKSKLINCPEPTIRQEELDRQLSGIIQQFVMPNCWVEQLQKMAEQEEQNVRASANILIQEARTEMQGISVKLDRLLTVYLEQDIDRDTYQQQKTELLFRKKALEEKIDDLEQGICPWRKPLEEWLKQAQDAGKTALSPSLSEKKSLLQKICGVNLSLQNRKVVFTPQNQWAALSAAQKKFPETDLCLVLVDIRDKSWHPIYTEVTELY
ncbi:MAG: recombinase family protein, partial [Candidatus Omnitrophica bacterium]|nr:recombinase family protein [Candidatus Omnitrophota bacterium]